MSIFAAHTYSIAIKLSDKIIRTYQVEQNHGTYQWFKSPLSVCASVKFRCQIQSWIHTPISKSKHINMIIGCPANAIRIRFVTFKWAWENNNYVEWFGHWWCLITTTIPFSYGKSNGWAFEELIPNRPPLKRTNTTRAIRPQRRMQARKIIIQLCTRQTKWHKLIWHRLPLNCVNSTLHTVHFSQ